MYKGPRTNRLVHSLLLSAQVAFCRTGRFERLRGQIHTLGKVARLQTRDVCGRLAP